MISQPLRSIGRRYAAVVVAGLLTTIAAAPASAQIPREFIYFGDQLLVYQVSFLDVLPNNPQYAFVNTIANLGITSGCGGGNYCPTAPVTREALALFLLKAKEGPSYVPWPCLGSDRPQLFEDVPDTNPYCPWIEELARRGIVSGCSPGYYCPTDPVRREQIAVYLLRTLEPSLSPPVCVPPNYFNDVPETSPFCRWIEELVRRNIAGGCSLTPPLFCPSADVTRGEMAVFLVLTFSL